MKRGYRFRYVKYRLYVLFSYYLRVVYRVGNGLYQGCVVSVGVGRAIRFCIIRFLLGLLIIFLVLKDL